MRPVTMAFIVGLSLAAGFACSAPKAPVGHWEGTYETRDTMIAARLEIDKDGTILISAPDMLDVSATDPDERAAIRQRIASNLTQDWAATQPRQMSFDGTVFRKPGGVAPQLEWNPDTKQMTMIVYFGTQPSVRVPLHAVDQFSDNPWPQ
ncbi:MAG: hypothetical protein KGR48_08475 [Alphaproteobacteria bacterium]|nr:hypothetical protein [Alphaproteobacteria bacterium]MBU6472474.1 hypothetical protein [Alphaproteobacteria bacterium]MDE2012795.1 hypothetical protein [Alphaproteobacteria bacterium]MDE2074651.1 hypothetical protein [Alphaproteobacteria bacterium]MDE2351292.1 hypothetical protein [Alphaproteobacteria bacterium]